MEISSMMTETLSSAVIDSEHSADEVELIRIINRAGFGGVCRAMDLRPAMQAAGWCAQRTRETLASLAARDLVTFHRSHTQECFIELQWSEGGSTIQTDEGLLAFNLSPAAKLFTVVAYPQSSIDCGTDGRIWRGLTEQEGIRLSDRLIADNWIVCGFDPE